MNLGAGIIGESSGWEELLQAVGLPRWPLAAPDLSPGACSALIVARPLAPPEVAAVRDHLRGGGAVMGSSLLLERLLERSQEEVHLSFIAPEEEGRLEGVSLFDVETTGYIPREANSLRTSDNLHAVFAGELHGGVAVVTPFDPGELMTDFRAVERYFYARPERLPSERVSRVAKAELMHFVLWALEYLHHSRGIPLARLSPFPGDATSVCALRIDTDGASSGEIDDLAEISSVSGVPFTWFVDTGSHRSSLGRFAALERQEVGLHCYDHRIYLDATKDRDNIRRGAQALKEAGVSPVGFAAPFGFWSPDLGRAIDGEGFRYSSEFAWACDGFPHYPVGASGRYATLQVPVHPIAIGGLRRSGYTPVQMIQYFHDVIDLKLARGEPLFFYHHPGHRHRDVIRDLCARCLGAGARPLTLGEYAAWWSARRNLRLSFRLEGEAVVTSYGMGQPGAEDPGVRVCISRQGKGEVLVPVGETEEGRPRRAAAKFSPPADIRRIREFYLRGEIGRRFTRLRRKFP